MSIGFCNQLVSVVGIRELTDSKCFDVDGLAFAAGLDVSNVHRLGE
jgi:hypothetical protein